MCQVDAYEEEKEKRAGNSELSGGVTRCKTWKRSAGLKYKKKQCGVYEEGGFNSVEKQARRCDGREGNILFLAPYPNPKNNHHD